jgi:TPR repeat protein
MDELAKKVKLLVKFGDIHYFGKNDDNDIEKALKTYNSLLDIMNKYSDKTKFEDNYGYVNYMIGRIYQDKGLDYLNYFKNAAIGDYVKGYLEMGYHYKLDGNYEKSINSFKLAAIKGDSEALYQLGLIYEELDDIDESENYYNQAKEKNNKDALFRLAEKYKQENNIDEANKYYKIAAENGHSEAQYIYATLILSTNLEEANKFYKMSAENGVLQSQIKLGNYYSNINQLDKAFKYLLMAAKQNNLNSQLKVADMYYNGEGVKKNISNSYYWFTKASQQNSDDAKQNLMWLFKKDNKLTDVQILELDEQYMSKAQKKWEKTNKKRKIKNISDSDIKKNTDLI